MPMEQNKTIFEAIATRKCFYATYNRMDVKLAPHILYTRHDELYVDAVTLEREGKPPKEIKLGSFKVAGLTQISLVDREFAPQPVFNPRDERYDGTTLFAVEMA